MLLRNLMISIGLVAALTGGAVAEDGNFGRRVEVERAELKLSHLFPAESFAKDAVIGSAPAPGERQVLSARTLWTLARGHGVAWQPQSALDSVTVIRRASEVSASALADAIAAALPPTADDYLVLLDNPGTVLRLPSDQPAEVEITEVYLDSRSGRFSAQVAAPSAARAFLRGEITGRALARLRIPVVQRRIAAGDTIRPEDVTLVAWRLDRLSPQMLRAPTAVVGMAAVRPITPDRPIRANELERPRLIQKNGLVTMVLQRGRLKLTAKGRALEPGALGEAIRLINLRSGTTVVGEVQADGSVRVAASLTGS